MTESCKTNKTKQNKTVGALKASAGILLLPGDLPLFILHACHMMECCVGSRPSKVTTARFTIFLVIAAPCGVQALRSLSKCARKTFALSASVLHSDAAARLILMLNCWACAADPPFECLGSTPIGPGILARAAVDCAKVAGGPALGHNKKTRPKKTHQTEYDQ